VNLKLPLLGAAALLLGLLAFGAGCKKANIAQLPADWPLKRLGLPRDSTVFEGLVKDKVELAEGATAKQWTVFFTCPADWAGVRDSTERELRALHFLRQEAEPTPMPAGAGPVSFSSAYATEDGLYLVVLMYEDSPEAREKLGRGFYTLLLQENTPALPPGGDFQPFS
jgi:hypothetical protein